MSTQHSSGTSFSILPEEKQQHLRLLELPSELLDLITSENPPILKFKSTNTSSDDATDSNAVLCTPNKTYQIRQVNTSNSVYVTAPTSSDDVDPGGSIAKAALQAIAQCNFSLELVPAGGRPAASYLRTALPPYSSTTEPQQGDKELTTKSDVFQDIPLSDAECELAWTELACFELSDPPGCFVPTAKVKAKAWHSIIGIARAGGIDLTSTVAGKVVDGLLAEDEMPIELLRAVLRSMSGESESGEMTLDEENCVKQVGLNELGSQGAPQPTASFTKAWADALPEKWRGKAQVQVLKGSYQLEGQNITFIDTALPNKASDSGGEKSTLGAKRKWHEKFRASKKAA